MERSIQIRQPRKLWTTHRAFCALLALLICFLSYRPATALFSIAGVAQNPSEDGRWGSQARLDARQNKPRPPKKVRCDRQGPQRVQKVKLRSDGGKSTNPIPEVQPSFVFALQAAASSATLVEHSARPEYLKLFLPAFPGSPHSPPA